MLYKISVFLIFSISINCCFSQYKVKNDTAFRYYSKAFNTLARISNPEFNELDFEMRFYVIEFSELTHFVYIFQHSLSNNWKIERFEFCSNDWLNFHDFKKDSITPSFEWPKRWDSLLKIGILKLPTESKVKNKWKSSSNIIPIIGDGTSYRFELITKNNKRKISYSNPEDKLPYYNLRNQELVKINQIIAVLNNELEFNKNHNKCQ